MVDDLADIERGDISVAVDTKPSSTAEDVVAGDIFVVRPSESVKVPSLCREPDELERIYQVGRRDAEATLPALEAYLAG